MLRQKFIVKFNSFILPLSAVNRSYASEKVADDVILTEAATTSGDVVASAVGTETVQLQNERYEKLKDISRIKPYHRMVLHGQLIPPNMFKWQTERAALRQRYAQHGKASGVDPRMLWPTTEELLEMRAEEAVLRPDLMYSVHAINTRKLQRETELEKRQKLLHEKLKNYKKELAAYRSMLREKQKELEEAEQRRKAKVQAIQEYFGYAVDPKDPRFQAMYDKKEEEEKKAAKMAKKEEKRTLLLQSLAGTIGGSPASPTSENPTKPD